MHLDGDLVYPSICGIWLEDYVGSAWGMGRHATHYGGCTLDVRSPAAAGPLSQTDSVGLCRWHLPDPVMYASDLKVIVQQIGGVHFPLGHEAEMVASPSHRAAGEPRSFGVGVSTPREADRSGGAPSRSNGLASRAARRRHRRA
jgi:hypothetical protein